MESFDQTITEPTYEELRQFGENESLNKRIIEVSEYIINNKSSIRKTADFFGISSTTVFDYCKKYEKIQPQKAKLLKAVLENNSEKTVKDKAVVERVLDNTKSILKGLTIEEVVEKTGYGYWTIYRDVTSRLIGIDKDLYEQVKVVLKSRSVGNLNNQQKK